MLRPALRRKSWNSCSCKLARLQAEAQADLSPWIRTNRDGTTRPAGAICFQALQLIERYRLLAAADLHSADGVR